MQISLQQLPAWSWCHSVQCLHLLCLNLTDDYSFSEGYSNLHDVRKVRMLIQGLGFSVGVITSAAQSWCRNPHCKSCM